ncbi:MAG: phage antirepressor KilAC domain-containing protein [Phascolarctobacterium sp.]|nr:phage antirepressor KilAC domain-containing protein [Phascolarctobacterium sp.]
MQLELIQNDKYKIRKTEYNGNIWFVGRDIADILGYKKPQNAVLQHVEEDDRFNAEIETPKGLRSALVINEVGVYSLILSSTLPAAKDFKHWICGDVIPSIRKTGAYMTDETLAKVSDNPEELQKLTTLLQQERSAHAETTRLLGRCEDMLRQQKDAIENMGEQIKSQNETIKVKDELITRKNAYFERNKPKIDFAKAVYDNKTAILIGEMAKLLAQNGIEIGQNRFFEWLRENGYLQRKEGNMHNVPYQKCIEQGLFIIKENTITNNNGDEIISRTPMVTGKGQRYFIAKFLQTRDEEALAAMSEEDLKLQADENRIIAEAQAMAKADAEESAQPYMTTENSTKQLDELKDELQKTKVVIAENQAALTLTTMAGTPPVCSLRSQPPPSEMGDKVSTTAEVEKLKELESINSSTSNTTPELESLNDNNDDQTKELEPIE